MVMQKSCNCHSKCRSKWHTNKELRKNYANKEFKNLIGKTRAYYDIAITKKELFKIMKKVRKQIEEEEEEGDKNVSL